MNVSFPDRVAVWFQYLLVQLVDLCRRSAIWVVIGLLSLSGLLLIYTVKNLTLDTNPLNLLDPSLPFRQLDEDFVSAFPQLDKLIVIVIDQADTDTVRDAFQQLLASIKEQSSLFSFVYDPRQGEFFDKYGLLYLSTDELWKLDERLSKWEPFWGHWCMTLACEGCFLC